MARFPLFCLLCLVSGLLLAACGGDGGGEASLAPSEEPVRPSLVLVVVDDWALSDLEASRTDGKPWNDLVAVDALAARGQSWRNFYAQPVCNPTRLSLMLGRYHGGGGGGVCNPPNGETPEARTTLASVLRAEGYATAAFGKWHIGTHPDPAASWLETPAAYGFDRWLAWNASNLAGHCDSESYFDWHRVDDGVARRSSEYHTEAVGRAFFDWWQETRGPRFAYVCFQAPHQPLHEPPAHLLPRDHPVPTTRREQYEAMLVALDTVLATMLAAVDLGDTYVFVVADNGTPPAAVRPGQQGSGPSQRGNRAKGTTFEDGVNVPLIVAGPGVRVGETGALGHAVDLPATFLELAGGSPPPGSLPDSVSLRAVLSDSSARPREHVICDGLFQDARVENESRDGCVVLETPRGLLKGRFFQESLRGTSTETFFDLDSDPAERAPLAVDDPLFSEDIQRAGRIWSEYARR